MDRKEHLLTIASEECSEVAQRISKALRFGLDEIQEGQDKTNAERIVYEFSDLYAMIKLLFAEGYIPETVNSQHVVDKMEKVSKWLDYSREQGTLI